MNGSAVGGSPHLAVVLPDDGRSVSALLGDHVCARGAGESEGADPACSVAMVSPDAVDAHDR